MCIHNEKYKYVFFSAGSYCPCDECHARMWLEKVKLHEKSNISYIKRAIVQRIERGHWCLRRTGKQWRNEQIATLQIIHGNQSMTTISFWMNESAKIDPYKRGLIVGRNRSLLMKSGCVGRRSNLRFMCLLQGSDIPTDFYLLSGNSFYIHFEGEANCSLTSYWIEISFTANRIYSSSTWHVFPSFPVEKKPTKKIMRAKRSA